MSASGQLIDPACLYAAAGDDAAVLCDLPPCGGSAMALLAKAPRGLRARRRNTPII